MFKPLGVKRIALLFVASVLTVLLVLFCFGAITAPLDAPPAGPTCTFEIDEGSGPAGTGREEIRWGLFPTKYCVGTMREGGSERVVEDDIVPFGSLSLLIFPFALFAGAATWFIGDQWLTRNDRSGSAAAEVP